MQITWRKYVLNFYNDRVLLDIEVDSESEDIYTPYGVFSETQKAILGEVNFYDINEPTMDGITRNIAIPVGMFNSFVHEWWDKSLCNRFEDSTAGRYLISYLDSFRSILLKGVDTPYFSYTDEMALYQTNMMIESYNIPFTPQPISIPDTATPEFSWMVEDFLVNLLRHRRSRYTDQILPIVQKNVDELKFYQAKFSTVSGAPITNIDLRLTKALNTDKINIVDLKEDLLNPQAILYFQSPFIFHRFETNFKHIKWCLEQYRNQVKHG